MGDLMYAYRPPAAGSSWTVCVVDSGGITGWHNSLAVDEVFGVHVSYIDFDDGDVRYAYRPAGGS